MLGYAEREKLEVLGYFDPLAPLGGIGCTIRLLPDACSLGAVPCGSAALAGA